MTAGSDPIDQGALADRLLKAAAGTYWDTLGCQVVSLVPKTVIALELGKQHLNHLGIVHGGVHAALLDQAMGIAAVLARPEGKIVTTNLNVHFTAAVSAGRLLAEAEEVQSSRHLLTLRAKVTDEKGTICAWGSGTFRVLELKGGG